MATLEQCKKFLSEIIPIMRKEAKARGYNIVSTAIAQACIESAYGTSSLGYKYHNYFGMKAGKSWKGGVVNLKTKEEYTPGTLTTITDGFRTYSTMEEGVKGYYDFISMSRYANLKTATNYQEYAEFLKKDGYATSSTYIKTLTDTVDKWNLSAYDLNVKNSPNKVDYSKPLTSSVLQTIRLGDKNSASVLFAQNLLQAKGYYKGKLDNIFGPKMDEATRKFQKDHGLKDDGIIGTKTWTELIKM